jgi:hypothetical protein
MSTRNAQRLRGLIFVEGFIQASTITGTPFGVRLGGEFDGSFAEVS